MAKRDSTGGDPAEGTPASKDKDEALIGDERRRLQKACAILDCLTFGLNYEGFHEMTDSELADVAAIASDLVSQAINNLDPVVRRRAVGTATVSAPDDDNDDDDNEDT